MDANEPQMHDHRDGNAQNIIIISTADRASVNIGNCLLDRTDWNEAGRFEDEPVRTDPSGCWSVITTAARHLDADHIDRTVADELGVRPQLLVFLSKHKSKSGIRSLTVHPIGNYQSADLGGKPSTVVRAAPHFMTAALRSLRKRADDLDFTISYEVTHHGPYLDTPTFFIEIGSDENAWSEVSAGEALAAVMTHLIALTTDPSNAEELHQLLTEPVAIGVGGGHYAPRFTDLARKRRVAVGHMVPNYQLKRGFEASLDAIELALGATAPETPALSEPMRDAVDALEFTKMTQPLVYFHRKGLKKKLYRELKPELRSRGYRVIRQRDTDPRD